MTTHSNIPPAFEPGDDDFVQRAYRYLHNLASREETQRFENDLLMQPNRRQQFVAICFQDSVIAGEMSPNRVLRDMAQSHWRFTSDDTWALLGEVMQQQEQAAVVKARELAQRQREEADELEARGRRMKQLFGFSEPVTPVRHYVIPKSVFYSAAASAIAFCAMLIWGLIPNHQQPQLAVVDEPTPTLSVLATVTRAANAVWSDESEAVQPGAPLHAGPLELKRGAVELTFANGARISLEAPASLELIDPRTLALREGLLVGLAPAGAHGFTVQTPRMNVVDLGTEFGVRVDQRQAVEVDVFDGKVRAEFAQPQDTGRSPIMLERLDGVTLDADARAARTRPSVEAPFAQLLQKISPHRVLLVNPSFEYPATDHYSVDKSADGWKFEAFKINPATGVRQPIAISSHAGVVLTGSAPSPGDHRAHHRNAPSPAHGRQWAYLETGEYPDGDILGTRAYQRVGQLHPQAAYELSVTIGSQNDRSTGGYRIGLFAAPRGGGAPVHELSSKRNPAPSAYGRISRVQLNYDAASDLDWAQAMDLFVVIESLSLSGEQNGQLLIDDVQLKVLENSL